jgi:phytoene synthase
VSESINYSMDQKSIYDNVSLKTSQLTTRSYSTSFSFGIRCLSKEIQHPIYAIYGFVRLADEIVDTFHGLDQASLLARFKEDTFLAISQKISLNPVLHSFQLAVNNYSIEHELVHSFLQSMQTDLTAKEHNQQSLDMYVVGSAEAVGLMCLRVFTKSNPDQFVKLKSSATKLGSAFQKVNFMRDLNADVNGLGRKYFPQLKGGRLSASDKIEIETLIQSEFDGAYEGIRQLPRSSRFGVYVAYLYYLVLFRKIRRLPVEAVMHNRVRVPNPTKFSLLCYSYVRHQLNLI